ncbi:MAG: hypothetical protein WDN25_14635 [Acetobacteraceae bacterium]
MRRTIITALTAVCLTLPAMAATPSGEPVATVNFAGGSVAAGVGVSWGQGTIVFQGKTHHFKIDGFNVGDVGIVKIDATGNVYNLAKMADFDGNYVAAGVGATVAGGGSIMTMQNPHGVVMHIHSATAGLRLNLGPSGIAVSMID